jgi:hypothetical protein
MYDTIEKIHAEFNTATDKLINIAKQSAKAADNIADLKETDTIEDGIFLKTIGFDNVPQAKKALDFSLSKNTLFVQKNHLSKKAEKIAKIVDNYSQTFPFNKFILYSQVIEILEKYNLFIGHSSLFKGEIPEKNVKEIKSFFNNYKDTKNLARINTKKPLCSNDGCESYSGGYMNFFICAPKADFQTGKNIFTLEKEIYKNDEFDIPSYTKAIAMNKLAKQTKDPIVLLPVRTDLNQLGFIVVTKWGLEAEDSRLIVPKLN